MTTFGFEVEFAQGVERALPILAREGLLLDGELHRYHCDCSWCDNWDNPLRAQTDSSCGGEIISGIFDTCNWEYALETMDRLCRALDEADVAVSSQCGLHVHIGNINEDLPRTYLGVEHLMTTIVAPGAFDRRRTMNRTLHQAARNLLRNETDHTVSGGLRWKRRWGAWMDSCCTSSPDEALDSLLVEAIGEDRHVDFNRDVHRTRTSEVRVFNGTRVPWRIELACRLSVALVELSDVFSRIGVTEAWVEHLDCEEPPEICAPSVLTEMLGDIDGRCAELFERQLGHVTGPTPRTSLNHLLDVFDPELGPQQFQVAWVDVVNDHEPDGDGDEEGVLSDDDDLCGCGDPDCEVSMARRDQRRAHRAVEVFDDHVSVTSWSRRNPFLDALLLSEGPSLDHESNDVDMIL